MRRVHEKSKVPVHDKDSAVVHQGVVWLLNNVDVATCLNGSSLPISSKNTTDLCALAIVQLQVVSVSQTTLITFVISMEEFVQNIQDQVKETALNCVSLQKSDIKIVNCKIAFQETENSFTLVKSIFK